MRTPSDRPDWEEGYYKVKKILQHRAGAAGKKEYLVEWHGANERTGQPWDPWWMSEEDVTSDLVKTYEAKHQLGIPSKMVAVDAALAYGMMRRTLAHALMFGAPKESGFQGRNRPRVHRTPVQVAMLQPVALGILDLMRKHGGPALTLMQGRVGKPDQWWQLIVKDLQRIAAICEFQHFVDSSMAVGNVRLTGTAKHSGDMLAVAQPVILTVKSVKHLPGIVSTVLEFPTVHFNGATGMPTYPMMTKGKLKKEKERAKLIAHVRDSLPPTHPLRKKGWCALPEAVQALAIEVAVPDGKEQTEEGAVEE